MSPVSSVQSVLPPVQPSWSSLAGTLTLTEAEPLRLPDALTASTLTVLTDATQPFLKEKACLVSVASVLTDSLPPVQL